MLRCETHANRRLADVWMFQDFQSRKWIDVGTGLLGSPARSMSAPCMPAHSTLSSTAFTEWHFWSSHKAHLLCTAKQMLQDITWHVGCGHGMLQRYQYLHFQKWHSQTWTFQLLVHMHAKQSDILQKVVCAGKHAFDENLQFWVFSTTRQTSSFVQTGRCFRTRRTRARCKRQCSSQPSPAKQRRSRKRSGSPVCWIIRSWGRTRRQSWVTVGKRTAGEGRATAVTDSGAGLLILEN